MSRKVNGVVIEEGDSVPVTTFDKVNLSGATTELNIHKHLIETRLRQSEAAPEAVNGVIAKNDILQNIVDKFMEAVLKLRGDHFLTNEGKADRLFNLVKATIGDLDKARSPYLDERVGSLMRKTDPARKTAEQAVDDAFGIKAMVDEMKLQEIRGRVLDMDPLELMLLYKEKAMAGDRRFIFAVDEEPINPLVSPEVQEEGHRLLRESLFPQDFAQLREATLLADAYNNFFTVAQQIVARFAGRPLEDPLAEVAAGTRSASDLKMA
ncbi:MAG: hypothetical protein ABL970_00990 [Nitrospira sp.]